MALNVFKTFKLTWWQASVFKSAMIAMGIALSQTWPEFFSLVPLIFWWFLAIVLAVYVTIVWMRQ